MGSPFSGMNPIMRKTIGWGLRSHFIRAPLFPNRFEMNGDNLTGMAEMTT